MSQFMRRVVIGAVTVSFLASFDAFSISQDTEQVLLEERFKSGFSLLQKIVEEHDRFRRECSGLVRKRRICKQERAELERILKNLGLAFPEHIGDLPEQTQTLINRLRFLEEEKDLSSQGAWSVRKEKGKSTILYVLAGIIATNLAIWGAVKMYHYVDAVLKTTQRGGREVLVIANHLSPVTERTNQQAMITQLQGENRRVLARLQAMTMQQAHIGRHFGRMFGGINAGE